MPLLLTSLTEMISPVGNSSTVNTTFGLPGTSTLPAYEVVLFILLTMLAR